MDAFLSFLVVLDLVFTAVFAWAIYQVLRFALSRVSEWRVSRGGRAIPAAVAVLVALASAISYIL